jgi:bifunctional DNA-binding transcriptional regulator/antitoxin component of YhaV-PrlF toxin-antitoxin module
MTYNGRDVIDGKHVMPDVKVSEGGRVVIPAELRQRYGFQVGDTLFWRETADGPVLQSRSAGIRRAQAIAAKYKKPGVSVVEQLIEERRAEAARE